MFSTLLISLPLFLIIFVGWLIRRSKIMGGDWVHQANAFAYNVALPALVIVSLWGIDFRDGTILRLLGFGMASLLAYLGVLFAGLSLARIGNDMKAVLFLTAGTGNALYLGIGLVQLGLGGGKVSAGTLVASMYFIVPLIVSIAAIRYWHTKDHMIRAELAELARNPLVISVAVGIALSFVPVGGHPLIGAIKQGMGMLGNTSSPVALVALGGFLYGKMLKKDAGKVATIAVLKMAVFPAIVWGMYRTIGGSVDVGVPVVLASMPVAVTSFVVAEKFKLDTELVGNVIVLSTIASFFVSPIILLLFR